MSLIRGCLSAKLNLSYPHHNSEFVQSLASYFQRENFLDLVFICQENVHVKAHKAVLSSISHFIKNIVLPHGQEVVYVNLPDVDHRKMQLLLDFLYGGISKVDSKELSSLQQILTLLCIHIPTAVIMAVTAVPNNSAPGTASVSEDKKLPIPLNPNLRIVPADSRYNLLNVSGGQFYNSGVNGNMTITGMGPSSASQMHGFPLQTLQFNENSASVPLSSATTFGMFSSLQPVTIKQEKIDDVDLNTGSVPLNSVVNLLNNSSNVNIHEVLQANLTPNTVLPMKSTVTESVLLNNDLNKLVPKKSTTVSENVPVTSMDICLTPSESSVTQQDTRPVVVENSVNPAILNSISQRPSSNASASESQDVTVSSKNENSKVEKNHVSPKDTPANSDSSGPASVVESTNSGGEKSRRKTVFTVDMVSLMEEKFKETKYPDAEYFTNFSKEQGLPVISVKRWFSHRREKHKRETWVKEKADGKKEMFTEKQIETLESKYKTDKHPSAVILKSFASEFEYPISLIERWFRQRREKDEKDNKNNSDTASELQVSEPSASVSASVISTSKNETSTPTVVKKEGSDADSKALSEPVERSRSSTPRSTASRSSTKDSTTPRNSRFSQDDVKKEISEQDVKTETSDQSCSSTPRSTASRSSTRDSVRETPQSAKSGVKETPQSAKSSLKETPQSAKSVKNELKESPNENIAASPVKRRVLRGSTKFIPPMSHRPTNRFFNDNQLVILESQFKKSHFPETEVFLKLSEELKTPVGTIRRWFAHRREKAKKELRMKAEGKKRGPNSIISENERYAILDARYNIEKYPSLEFVESVSKKINMLPSSIRRWFSLRRERERRLGNTTQRASDSQRDVLEAAFKKNNFPDRETYEQLSADTQLPLKFVMRWFVDKRFKLRKGHMNRAASLLKSSVSLARGVTNSKNTPKNTGLSAKNVHRAVPKKVISTPIRASVVNKKVAQQKRTSQKSPKQIEMLEQEYKKNPYPTSDRYQELSLMLKLGTPSVRSWFKIKRKRQRLLLEKRKLARVEKQKRENINEKKSNNKDDVDEQSGRKKLTRFSPEQKEVLEKLFKKNMNPSAEIFQKLGQELNLREQVVSVWFSNRRAKYRKESQNTSGVQKTPTEVTVRQSSVAGKRTASPVTPSATLEVLMAQPEKEEENEDVISENEEQEPQSKKRKLSTTHSSETTVQRKKRRFTDAEKEVLEDEFSKNMYPTIADFERIAEMLGIPRIPVRTWFAHRRKCASRESKTSPQVTKQLEPVKTELTSPAINTKKIKRTVFSEWQRHVLEKEYRRNSFPELDVVEKVASDLKLPSRAIVRWFRNRRKRAGVRLPSNQKTATSKSASLSQQTAAEVDLSGGSDDEKEETVDLLESVSSSLDPAEEGEKSAKGCVVEDLFKESNKESKTVKEKKKYVFNKLQENVLEELYQSSGMPDEAMLDCLKSELQIPNTEILKEWFNERATNGMTDPEPFKCSWGGCTQKFSNVDMLEGHFISHSKLVITVKPEQ